MTMSTMSFDQILRAARQLTPQERDALIAHLRAEDEDSSSERGALLREEIVAEFERRKAAGAFDNLESLKGKFARPGGHADADEMEAYLRGL
ncbi:MAG: hypothetical protein JXB30_02975 [Anaerolineae bacterium]|nr:hypothetical protein [Anaerolineae bacterium]